MKLDKQKWIQEVRRVESEIKLLKKMMHEPNYQSTFPFSSLFELKAEATRLYTLRRVVKINSLIEMSKSPDFDDAWRATEALTRYPMEGVILQRMTEIAQVADPDFRRMANQALAGLPTPDCKVLDLKSFWYSEQSHYDKNRVYAYYRKADKLTTDQIVSLILDRLPSWKDSFLS